LLATSSANVDFINTLKFLTKYVIPVEWFSLAESNSTNLKSFSKMIKEPLLRTRRNFRYAYTNCCGLRKKLGTTTATTPKDTIKKKFA
jgi:hypothetical protein